VVRAASPDVLLLQECPTRGFELDPSRYVRCGARLCLPAPRTFFCFFSHGGPSP
jgi:hypothetical protein